MIAVTQPPLIVLTLEGLSPAALSCYGSSWNRTPVIDSLAASGCVWDRCYATSDEPDRAFRQMVRRLLAGPSSSSGTVELQTDVPSVISESVDRHFDRIDLVTSDAATSGNHPASEIIETQLGRLFASAIARTGQSPSWQVLWIHSGFLTRRWDAPRDDWSIADSDEPPEPQSPAMTDPETDADGDATWCCHQPLLRSFHQTLNCKGTSTRI